jgi:hypothetical protein
LHNQYQHNAHPIIHLGGWQIDDVTLISYVAAPACCQAPASYCVTMPNSAGPGALIASSGSGSIAANDFVLTASACPPDRLGFFVYGLTPTQQVFGNGILCINNVAFQLPVISTSPVGTAAFPVNFNLLPAGGQITSGSTWNFQFLFRDPTAGGANFNLSNAQSATFCP